MNWKGQPRFFWFALVAGVLVASALVFESVNLVRLGQWQKVIGWAAAPAPKGWTIARVDAGSPADGKLQRGDRILAIDADKRAEFADPSWRMLSMPPDRHYRITVERAGRGITVPLEFTVRRDAQFLAWGPVFLLIALTFLSTALLIGLLRPGDAVGRYGFGVSILLSMFMLWVASNPLGGMLGGIPLYVSLALSSVLPLHVLVSYLFYAVFPEGRSERGGWRFMRDALVVIGIALWIPSTAANVIHAIGVDFYSHVLSRNYAAYLLFLNVIGPAQLLFLAAISIATLAVGWRNYRRLPEGDLRRRFRWVAWGVVAGTLPSLAIQLIWALIKARGMETGMAGFITIATRVSNTAVVVIPITMCYAILKHRVLGIRVVLRMGVRYLLAANLLRAVLFLPLAGLALVFLLNPNKTLAELLFQPTARINLLLLLLAALSLRYRTRLSTAIDRRFFRDAYNREQILVHLAESIKNADSVSGVSRILSDELESAFHPQCVGVFFREQHRPEFSLIHTSGHTPHQSQLADSSPLVVLLEQNPAPQSWRELRARCPESEARWIDPMNVQLVIPVLATDHRVLGILLLGEKKSEEPYTRRDQELLEAIAAQIGVLFENYSLRERVHRDRQTQQDVLARLEARQVNLLRECPTCGACYDSTSERCDRDGSELVLTLPVERVIDGKYRLMTLLGRGGMGAVYRAFDVRLDRSVAIKVMTGSLFGNAGAAQRFAREARASARLDHANIVRVHDFGELSGGGAYLVMELVAGLTLRAVLRTRGVIPPPEAAKLLDELLAGVEAAHKAQIIHRDLKPENVLIAENAVKILDFGLAKLREMELAEPERLTIAGTTVGTLGYMSPEQLMGEDVDQRTDVYSLGVIALEMLTGELKLRGRAFHEQIDKAMMERFAFEGNTVAHRKVGAVLSRALAFRPGDRIESVTTLRSELLGVVRSCPPFPGTLAKATGSEETRTLRIE